MSSPSTARRPARTALAASWNRDQTTGRLRLSWHVPSTAARA